MITSHEKPVGAQLEANPKVEISSMTPDGRWLRLAAEAVEDVRFEARKAMLDANPNLRRMYSEDDGKIFVFYLRNAVATINSYTAPPVEIRF